MADNIKKQLNQLSAGIDRLRVSEKFNKEISKY